MYSIAKSKVDTALEHAAAVEHAAAGSVGEGAPLRVDGLAASQHGDEAGDAPGSRRRRLGGADPVEDGVAILAVQDLKHGLSRRVGGQGHGQVGCDLDGGR